MDEIKTEEHIPEMTAGEMLRNARTTGRRKREIPTIAKQLCIREEFLQALEDGNYTFIPELVYILGFARNYAMELGLNPDEIVNKIKVEMGVMPDVPTDTNNADATAKAPKAKSGTNASTGGALKVCTGYIARRWKMFVAGVVILAIVVIAAIFAVMSLSSDVPVTENDAAVVETVSNEPKYNLLVRERWGVENRDDAQVILQANRGSWIKVEDGRGKTEFSRVLVEGDVYYVPTVGKFKATFGDAGGIDIWVNGQLAPKAGPDHVRKADISLSPEKLMPQKDKVVSESEKPETK
ncbi:MAG: DUF4115 domain-containing protein [Prevotella sp.]|nr:DUF4115 domain-containing protein [Muribaculaceae bacterium]MCM1404782.1 DUF4115 domain-containing protein [Prevotella sp.]